ncbi:MAG: NAD(P)/FAD-dependent oxidoreductase [Anaerolineae bacterium]|nr:NAD(P)/FAD-dependent oxidoreductase [Anaerolineae bacterium]
MPDYDVVIVGAGHNALVCGGYLAKAGYRVALLERRHKVGGAVVTEEIIPGFQFDLGGSAHILINHTPIVSDLNLTAYGLEYIDLDPLFFAPFPDGSHITMWKDVDRTCESIAAVSPADAEAYRRFIDKWKPVAEGMVEAFLHPPTPLNLGRYMIFGSGFVNPNPFDQLSDLLRGYGQVMRQTFQSEQVRALISWMAAQSGPPPGEPLSAPFALWHPMYHVSGVKRPRGGSGMLTQALAKMIEAYGGTILTDATVKRIIVREGRAVGVETEPGDMISARTVISGAHIHTTLNLLDDVPPLARSLLERARIGNGFGMIVRYAMDELPNYTALPSPDDGSPGPQHRALQFICPDMHYLESAYGDYLAGRPSSDPALIAMTFSAADPSLAPPGKHTLFLWGQYYPYELASGDSWDDISETVAAQMLATLAKYAPNVEHAVIDKLIETPLYLERTLGLLRGNVMHLEMSIDQMFMMRPALTMGNYRGPVKGLYFTGASTHPGGGIMGAAGRNAASVVLHDLSRGWR